jgi:hypothetical protein
MISHVTAGRPAFKRDAGGTADGAPCCERGVDFDERAWMNLGVRIDEGENLAAGNARTSVARGRNDALLDLHNLAAVRRGNACGKIHRAVVGHDDFDFAGIGIRVSRNVDRTEQAG